MQPKGEHAASTALSADNHNHITWYPNIWDQIDIAGSARNGVRDIAQGGECSVRVAVVEAPGTTYLPDGCCARV